jgi:hypothetical protein
MAKRIACGEKKLQAQYKANCNLCRLSKTKTSRMKTLLLLNLSLIPFLSFAQHNSGYFSFVGSLNFPTNVDEGPILGGHASRSTQLGTSEYLGLEAGVVKFKSMHGVYIPIQLKYSLMPAKDPRKVSALIVLAPGYGIYKQADTKGGLVFYGGVGAAFPGKGKGGGYLTVGYSSFAFTSKKSTENNSTVSSVGVRAGVMIGPGKK